MSSRPTLRRAVVALVLAPWAAWAVVRLLGLERGPLVALIAFTPLVAASAWLPVVALSALRWWRAAAVGAAVAVMLAACVLPRAVGTGQPPVPGGRSLTVMTANLEFGRGDTAALLELARRARVDLISVQELTPAAARRLAADGARAGFAHRVLVPEERALGSGLLARAPLRATDRDAGGLFAMPEARLLLPGAPPVDVKAVHPPPPLTANRAAWRRDLRALRDVARDAPGLAVLAGDFNATLDHRAFRRILDEGFVDAADEAGAGLRPTWPDEQARTPPLLTIDHIVADERIAVRGATVHDLPGSDHHMVIARLVLPARAGGGRAQL